MHSTETALVKVHTDVLRAVDNNDSVVLLLLDLSAAFATVDHSILLSRLALRFGVNGRVIVWIEAYLKDREQFVLNENTKSSIHQLLRGVPQGSVLGPLLYVLCTAPLLISLSLMISITTYTRMIHKFMSFSLLNHNKTSVWLSLN